MGYPWLPVVTEDVEADSPLLVVLTLMDRAHLRFVKHAEAHADDTKVLTRFDRLKLYTDPVTAPAADESEVDG